MDITAFFTAEEGTSYFADISIPLDIKREDAFGYVLSCSQPYSSDNVQLVQLPADLDQDLHNAPATQLVVVLSGTIEVETSGGECRRWDAGGIFMPADVAGRGHRTRVIGGPALVLFAPFPDDFNVNAWASPETRDRVIKFPG